MSIPGSAQTAWEAYQTEEGAAWKAYDVIETPAWKAYLAVVNAAWEKAQKRGKG